MNDQERYDRFLSALGFRAHLDGTPSEGSGRIHLTGLDGEPVDPAVRLHVSPRALAEHVCDDEGRDPSARHPQNDVESRSRRRSSSASRGTTTSCSWTAASRPSARPTAPSEVYVQRCPRPSSAVTVRTMSADWSGMTAAAGTSRAGAGRPVTSRSRANWPGVIARSGFGTVARA